MWNGESRWWAPALAASGRETGPGCAGSPILRVNYAERYWRGDYASAGGGMNRYDGWLLCGIVAAAIGALSASAEATDIRVTIDDALVVKLPERVATLVIGNPLIADVTLVRPNEVVITGKSYGETNLIVLGRGNAILAQHALRVVSADYKTLVVHGGTMRNTFICAPACERQLMLGDDGDISATVRQAAVARGGSAPAGGPCDTPDQIAADGSRCGDRAASVQPGGRQ